VLGGFLITRELLRAKGRPRYFRDFYTRRALRYLPLYWAVLALVLFVVESPPVSFAETVRCALFVQTFWSGAAVPPSGDVVHGVLWAVAIGAQFALVWPAFVLLGCRRALFWCCLAVIAASTALRLGAVDAGVVNVYRLTPLRLDSWAAGALLAVVPLPRPWAGWSCFALGAAALVGLSLAAGGPVPFGNPPLETWGFTAALLLGAGLVVLAHGAGTAARVLANPVLRSFGKYGYCIYLLHVPVMAKCLVFLDTQVLRPRVQSWVALYGFPEVPVSIYLLLSLAVTWLVAMVVWRLFERLAGALRLRISA
jgi:peptidoglycan/LPS O-acetylase OafA/YrhL